MPIRFFHSVTGKAHDYEHFIDALEALKEGVVKPGPGSPQISDALIAATVATSHAAIDVIAEKVTEAIADAITDATTETPTEAPTESSSPERLPPRRRIS
jgi:hypothetical protein